MRPAWAGASVLLSLLLLLGWFDRIAALALAAVSFVSVSIPLLSPAPLVVGFLLLFHVAVPPAPYGSWAARGRADPADSWRMPPPLATAAWVLLVLYYLATGLFLLAAGHFWLALPGLAFLPLALRRSWRPWLWGAMLAFQVALAVTSGAWTGLVGLIFLHLFAFDPAWVKPAPPATPERLFYDGTCGLCHRAVRFLLAEDPTGSAFRFAPLDSETFREACRTLPRGPLPDSLILEGADGSFLARSAGALRALARLGGAWRLLAALLTLIPASLRDAVYDGVARVRYRLFARPTEACPVIPRHLRARFDL